MIYFTDFADQAVLLPLALIVALCLGVSGWWQGAAAWLLGVGTTLVVMLILKLAFMACGPDQLLRTPSGHTAAAAVVCGGLMVVLAGSRRWAMPVACVAAALIGASRLALDAHTPLEVAVGALAGISGTGLIAMFAGPMPAFRRNWVAVAALFALLILHGMHMPAEAHIRGFAERMALYLPSCRAV